MKEEITRCDICGSVIKFYDKYGMIAGKLASGGGQIWPITGGESLDLCNKCAAILLKADDLEIIDFDMTPVYELTSWLSRTVEDKK